MSRGGEFETEKKTMNSGLWSKNFLSVFHVPNWEKRVVGLHVRLRHWAKPGKSRHTDMPSLSSRYVPRSRAPYPFACLAVQGKPMSGRRLQQRHTTSDTTASVVAGSREQDETRTKTGDFTCEQMSGLPAKFLDPSARSMALEAASVAPAARRRRRRRVINTASATAP